MYLYITTARGRFQDTREITSDNLDEYLSVNQSNAYADSATVAEFEEFFANMRTEAEEIIHISMAANAGKTYAVTCQAARGFGHVHVIDSGQISGGQALVVMEAVRLLKEGKNVEEICAGLESYKRRVRTSFVLPTPDIFAERGYAKQIPMRLFSKLHTHPMLRMEQSRICVCGFFAGNVEHCWKRYLRRIFACRKKKIDMELVYVAHVGLSVRQVQMLRAELRKRMPFENILVEKASVSNACNGGHGTISVAFVRK